MTERRDDITRERADVERENSVVATAARKSQLEFEIAAKTYVAELKKLNESMTETEKEIGEDLRILRAVYFLTSVLDREAGTSVRTVE